MSATATATIEKKITDNQRYDRQIRVWGAEAQSRIQNARILLCGCAALNVEVAKNLVLAGMSLTIVDSRTVCETDLFSNFFLSEEDMGKKMVDAVKDKVHELNPNVTITAIDALVAEISAELIHNHDVVLLNGESEQTALRINEICRAREQPVKFFWSDSFGDEAIFFSDFGPQFSFRKDQSASNNAAQNGSASAPAVISLETISFPSLKQTLGKPWKSIPSRHVELSPIYIRFCAVARFRQEHGRNPTEQDEAEFTKLLSELLRHNEVDLLSSLSPSVPLFLAVTSSGLVLNASILGSFLSQEVIKAISLVGAPGVNVFVYNGKNNSVMVMPIV